MSIWLTHVFMLPETVSFQLVLPLSRSCSASTVYMLASAWLSVVSGKVVDHRENIKLKPSKPGRTGQTATGRDVLNQCSGRVVCKALANRAWIVVRDTALYVRQHFSK